MATEDAFPPGIEIRNLGGIYSNIYSFSVYQRITSLSSRFNPAFYGIVTIRIFTLDTFIFYTIVCFLTILQFL